MFRNHYYLFLDESGTELRAGTNGDGPFVVAGVIINRPNLVDYIHRSYELKAKHWLHPETIHFHSHDIRRRLTPFNNPNERSHLKFLAGLSELISSTEFTLICSGIMPADSVNTYARIRTNSYHQAFMSIMERTYYNLKLQSDVRLTIIPEARDPTTNSRLRDYYNQMVDGVGSGTVGSSEYKKIRPTLLFRDKKSNTSGLELADLCALPVRRRMMDTTYSGLDYAVVKTKLKRNPANNSAMGWGIKLWKA